MSFVHLHCHSEYSLLDGANRIDDLITRALEFEQPALAITDHGNLHGAWEFQEKAKKAGLKPIIGMEAYVAPGDRRARDRVGGDRGKPYYHLVLLAQNATGYKNLVKLSSLAYTEGFYAKPRMDRELLAKYNEGIVVSSACMAGEIAHNLLSEDYDQARVAASWYADVFRDRYYLEVQAHDSENQATLNSRVFQLAAELNLPVLATNDAHFLTRGDHDAHDILLCIGLGKDFSDTNRMHYDEGLYFKSAPEIAEAFPGRKDVLENSLRIADETAITFSKQYKVPSFPLPSGIETENELLVRLSEEGAHWRYGADLPANVRERLDYELGVITSTGYAGYFLIVADFIKAARDFSVPNVMIWPTESRPYFCRTYSITSPRRSKQKSTSMSGIETRSGFRNRSKSRSNCRGSTSVMRSEYATSDPAAEPRPGPTGMFCSRAYLMKSQTIMK